MAADAKVIDRSIIGEGTEVHGTRLPIRSLARALPLSRDAEVTRFHHHDATCHIVSRRKGRTKRSWLRMLPSVGEGSELGVGEYAPSKYDPKVYQFDLVTIGEHSVIPDHVKIGKNTAISGVTTPEDYTGRSTGKRRLHYKGRWRTMKAIGIVLAGGNSKRMRELSNKRAISAMPVAGSYRSIDFALSNMSNSHIQNVAVFTQYNSRSLNEHLSSSKWWDFGRKQGGLYVFTPTITAENSDWYRGTADALYQNLTFLKNSHEPYVVIAAGDGIYKLDYNEGSGISH